MASIDVTSAWKWRAREKDRFERETGYKLTLLPFFIRAVVESLSAFPLMNAKFTAEGIYVNKDVNIGIAIGLPTTLIVPVIKNADKLSIKGIAIAAGELIDKARRGKLGADDLAGGTFTVNNNGANGSWASAPIINAGQAGIVTMETVEKRLLVRDDDSFAPRYVMNSCLSLDHRVVDGYVASGFLADLKKRIERMTCRRSSIIVETTHAIKELLRLPSPAPLPLGLALDGDTLWMESRETQRLYAIDREEVDRQRRGQARAARSA